MRTALVFTVFMAIFAVMCMAAAPARVCFEGGENYTFYCGHSSADCREVHPVLNAEAERLLLKDVCGESAEYKSLNIEEYLKSVNGKVLFEEKTGDSVNYYCSADFPYSVNLYGQEVNLHICVKEDRVKIASPIIFGGY